MTQVVHAKHPHHVSNFHKAHVVHAVSNTPHVTPQHTAKTITAPVKTSTQKTPPHTSHSSGHSPAQPTKLPNSHHSQPSHRQKSLEKVPTPVHKNSHSSETTARQKTKTPSASKNSNFVRKNSNATPTAKPSAATFFPVVAPIETVKAVTPALKSGLFNPSIAPLERYNQAQTYTDTLPPVASTPTVETRLENAGNKIGQEASSVVQPFMKDGKQFFENTANTIEKDATVVKEDTQRAVKVIEEVLHHNPGYPTENDLPAPYNPCKK